MPHRPTDATAPKQIPRRRGQRRLIAGLRVSELDERLLALVTPFFPEVDSAGDLAYRLWRRGLELTLAEAVGLGATLPSEVSEELIAGLVAQRLVLCVPLLRRTGGLARLGLETPPVELALHATITPPAPVDAIDSGAAAAITSLGGSDFL